MPTKPEQFKELESFLENNDIKMGVDFSITPPLYHHSLEDGFYNYFKTYNSLKENFDLFLDTDWTDRKSISFNYSRNEYKECCVTCIIGFHRFFELYIKDILSRYDERLPTDQFKNITNVREFLEGKGFTPNPAAINQTVEFDKALQRFKLFKELYNSNNLADSFTSINQYFFLLTDDVLEVLDRLKFWRNRISHNGTKLPNFLALEYLISQRITPLAIKIYEIEKLALKDYIPRFMRNKIGIDLLLEIANDNAKFSFNDFFDPSQKEAMQYKLMYLAHLKELGRASVTNPFLPFAPPGQNENLKIKYEKFATLEGKTENFVKQLICPCCGAKALVTYRYVHQIHYPKSELEKYNSKCYACTYEINNSNIDPFHIGLFSEPVHIQIKKKFDLWHKLKLLIQRFKGKKK